MQQVGEGQRMRMVERQKPMGERQNPQLLRAI